MQVGEYEWACNPLHPAGARPPGDRSLAHRSLMARLMRAAPRSAPSLTTTSSASASVVKAGRSQVLVNDPAGTRYSAWTRITPGPSREWLVTLCVSCRRLFAPADADPDGHPHDTAGPGFPMKATGAPQGDRSRAAAAPDLSTRNSTRRLRLVRQVLGRVDQHRRPILEESLVVVIEERVRTHGGLQNLVKFG